MRLPEGNGLIAEIMALAGARVLGSSQSPRADAQADNGLRLRFPLPLSAILLVPCLVRCSHASPPRIPRAASPPVLLPPTALALAKREGCEARHRRAMFSSALSRERPLATVGRSPMPSPASPHMRHVVMRHAPVVVRHDSTIRYTTTVPGIQVVTKDKNFCNISKPFATR